MRRYSLIFLAIVLALFGCTSPADISSPKQYQQNNIQLSYPSNWEITQEIVDDDFFSLAIEDGNAVVILQRYPLEQTVPLNEFVSIFSDSVTEALPFGKVEGIEVSSIKKTVMSKSTEGTREDFMINFLGFKVPHVREYFKIESGEYAVFLVSHSPIKDVSNVEPGFRLIFNSMATK